MKFKQGIAWVIFFFIFSVAGFPQYKPVISNYHSEVANTGQFGFTFGPAIYHGDLNVGNFNLKRSTGLAASLFGQYYFSEAFGFRISLFSGILNGGIKTYVKSGKEVEDSFTGIILEGDLHMIINFSNLFFRHSPKRRFFVYGTVGLGYAGWYSKLTNMVYNYDSLPYVNPLSNFNASFVIPAGLGVYYRIGNRLNAGLEYTYKTYLSDKLDNEVPAGYPYDVVHYIALNISVNLGTGQAKQKPRVSNELQPMEYSVSYPVSPRVYSPPPPEVKPVQEDIPRIEYYEEKPIPKIIPKARGRFCYSVQICAFDQHRYSTGWIRKHYHISEEVRLEKEGKMERFMVGRCNNEECARALLEKMKTHGIPDAFIVTYQSGRRYNFFK
ncbi:MAG: hypothetical protein NTX43_12450 [Bacteroidetes bacterium]|nr:hypothetical protein [Bacteroidota bacterium]